MAIAVVANSRTFSSLGMEEFAEDSGSPEEDFEGDMLRAEAVYKIPWYKRWDIMQALMPSASPGRGMDLALTMPAQYPYRIDLQMYAKSCSCRPWVGSPAAGSAGPHDSSDTAVLRWQWGKLRIKFESLQNNNPRSLVWQESFAPAVEFVTASAQDTAGNDKLWWEDGTPIGTSSAPGLRIIRGEWTVTRRWAPLAFPAEIMDYQGMVNSAAVTSGVYPSLSFTAGQLLYDHFEPEQDRFADGSAAVKLTMHFMFMMQGTWLTFPRVLKAGSGIMPFEAIYKDKTATNRFLPFDNTHDLNVLLGW